MYAWLAKYVIKYRRGILVCLAAAGVILATTVPNLRFDFTPQQLFQSNTSASAFRDEFAQRFGREDNLVAIAVTGPDVFAPEVLTSLRDAPGGLEQLDSIKQAESVATFAIPRAGDTAGTMTVEPILDTSAAPGEPVEPGRAAKLERVALDEPLIRGRLVGAKAHTAMIVAWIEDDVQSAQQLDAAVDALEARLADYPLADGYRYRVGGIPKLRTDIVAQLRSEQLTFLPLTGFIYIVLLLWLFRRKSGAILPVLTVSFAVLATVATLVWTDSSINIVNNVLPSLIFIIGISDSIHMLTRDAEEVRAGKSRQQAIHAMVSHTGLACLLTSLTTAVGFISLLAADTDILQRFGWQAAAGVMFAYVATLLLLPAALSYMRPVRLRRPTGSDDGGLIERVLVGGGRRVIDHAGPAIVASVLVAAAFGALAFRVDIDTTLLEVFEEGHPSYETTDIIEERMGGFLPIEVSLDSASKDRFKDPEIYKKMDQFQRFAQHQPGVLSTRSIVDFHQSARVALLGDDDQRRHMPESRAQIEQLHLLIAGSPDDHTGVNKYVTSDFRHARILVRVSDVGAKAQLKLADHFKAKLGELFGPDSGVQYRITGDAYVASVSLDSFIRDLFYSLLVAIVIIFAMMSVSFRSLKLGLISVLPNTIPLVMTFGYMGLRDIDLNTSTIIIFAISLGLAVDDTIHFLARFREEFDRQTTVEDAILAAYEGAGRAILLTSVMLVTGLAVLLTSDFVPTRQFGILTSITIVGAVLGDLILLPALLYVVYRDGDESADELV